MTDVDVNGKIVRFPDDMTPAEIEAAINELQGVGTEALQSQSLPAGPAGTGGLGEALLSLGSAIGAEIAGGIGAFATAPQGSDTAVNVLEGTREKLTFQPRTQQGQNILQGIGAVGEGISTAVRAPVAGLAGLFGPSNISDEVLEQGIGGTAGRVAFEATDSPLIGSAVEAGPTGLAALLSAGASQRIPKDRTPERPQTLSDLFESVEDVPPRTISEPSSPADLATAIRKERPGRVAEQIAPDPEIIEAARRLGLDLNPEHYATNAAFQEVARTLKARPGSRLEANERIALQDLSDNSNALIREIGGDADKSAVSEAVSGDVRSVIVTMENQADLLYGKVDEAIPKATRVEPNNVRQYLDEKLEELGGDKSLLATAEKKLLKLTAPKVTKTGGIEVEEPNTPTYAALDRVRRDVGNGFNRRSGPFKDDDTGTLRQVYRVLSEDQGAVAEAFGIDDIYNSAREIVSRRKAIEDQATFLFGRNLSDSLVPKINLASTSLPKGDITKFNKLMDALPEARRAEVAASVLDSLFAAGSRRGGSLSQGFVASFQALNRNKAAKDVLFRHLPPEARSRFDDIGKVYTAIVKANQKPLSNPSGSAAPIIAALEGEGVLSKIYKVSKRATAAEGVTTTVGLPGAGTAGVIGSVLTKGKTPGIEVADNFLTSEAFRTAMNRSLRGDIQGANSVVEKSPKFRKWLGTLDQPTVQRILTTGFIGWLVSEEE